MEFEEQIDILERINNEYAEIFNRHFKGLRRSSGGYAGTHFHSEFAISNSAYKKSDYYYDLEANRKFIHFTSLPNLFSILSEQAIRLYNLTNSNDDQEYEHTARILNVNTGWQRYAKENAFTFSFCHPSELENVELWANYTRNGEGCCVEFEIVNEANTWENYHLSSIKYDKIDAFNSFRADLEMLESKYPGCAFQSELGRLMIFHKSGNWSNEKEIRLATYTGDFFGSYHKRKRDFHTEIRIDRETKDVRYIDFTKLPIASKKWNDLSGGDFKEIPKIQIKRILLGQRIPFNHVTKGELRLRLMRILQEKLGYQQEEFVRVLFYEEWKHA